VHHYPGRDLRRRTLEEWKAVLVHDRDAVANSFIQDADYGDGRSMKMVAVPVQFDGKALAPRPAPALRRATKPPTRYPLFHS